jgi:hypothetical protein
MCGKFRFSGRGEFARAGWRLILYLLIMFSANAGADVHATLDRSTLAAGDTVTLTIQADGQQTQGASPDLSPLRKDFNILGTSTSQQMQIINGRMSSSASLRVELEPKHGGTLEIPALKVGGETTRPLTLTVADQPAATASQPGSPLYLETEVQPDHASTFVQQQIQYTTRLYYSVPLIDGSLGDPEPEHAVVERLGEDKHYQTTVNGQRYEVIERNYAIFPEQSGTFTIPPVSFTGRAATGGGARRPFGRMDSMMEQFFGRDPFGNDSFFATPFGDPGKRVHTSSEAVTVEVKPHPASYSAKTWLPGEDLELHDSWAVQPPEFRVGVPVTRVISIDAKGLAASHLPEVAMPAIAGMRVYPDQPRRESRTDGAVVYGHSEQSFAFVPQQAGRVTLPEIRLNWWDIKAGKEQVAVLPSWNVDVLPGAGGVQGAPAAPPATVSQPQAQPQPVAGQPTGAIPAPWKAWKAITDTLTAWPWIAGGCVLLILIALAAVRHRLRRKPPAAPAPVAAPTATPTRLPAADAGATLRALQQACNDNDARAAARALLDWAAAEWPDNPPRNLGAVASRLESAAGAEVRRLDQSLYAPGGVVWNGAALGNAFRTAARVKQPARPKQAADGLAPLYPEWGKRLR